MRHHQHTTLATISVEFAYDVRRVKAVIRLPSAAWNIHVDGGTKLKTL